MTWNRDIMTYNVIKNILSDKEIYISHVLELLKDAKSDIRQWEKFIKLNLDYDIKDIYFYFDKEFMDVVKIAIEELEKYNGWILIKCEDPSDIIKSFKDSILGSPNGTFSFDTTLHGIEVFIRHFFNTRNYCLINFDDK